MIHFLFVLRRDLFSQHWRCSRNLREGFRLKTLRLFWCFVYFWKAVYQGLNAIRSEQLGSRVIYQGKKLRISNWAGSDFPTLAGDGFYQQNVPRKEIQNVISFREAAHRFLFGFEFYLSYWHGIDVQRKIYPEYYKES